MKRFTPAQLLDPTLKRMGIRYRRPFSCHHPRATEVLIAGINHAFAAGQLSHSVEIVFGTYAKWLTGAGDDAEMAKLKPKANWSLAGPQEKLRQS